MFSVRSCPPPPSLSCVYYQFRPLYYQNRNREHEREHEREQVLHRAAGATIKPQDGAHLPGGDAGRPGPIRRQCGRPHVPHLPHGGGEHEVRRRQQVEWWLRGAEQAASVFGVFAFSFAFGRREERRGSGRYDGVLLSRFGCNFSLSVDDTTTAQRFIQSSVFFRLCDGNTPNSQSPLQPLWYASSLVHAPHRHLRCLSLMSSRAAVSVPACVCVGRVSCLVAGSSRASTRSPATMTQRIC